MTIGGCEKYAGVPADAGQAAPTRGIFSFTWRGRAYRFSLDRYLGRTITSRGEAEQEAERIRVAIRAGTFMPNDAHQPIKTTVATLVPENTCDQSCSEFLQGYSRAAIPGRRRTGANGVKSSWKDDAAMLKVFCAFSIDGQRLGTLVLTIEERQVLQFLQHLAAIGRAASTRNHYLRLLRLLGRWAIRHGHRRTLLIADDSELRQDRECARNRRLDAGDEERLLHAARPRLQALIIAALETCARSGELLSLQWREVDLPRRRLRLLARKTKDGEERVILIPCLLDANARDAGQSSGRSSADAGRLRLRQRGGGAHRLGQDRLARRVRRPGSPTCASTTCGTRRGRGSWRRAGPFTTCRRCSGTRT